MSQEKLEHLVSAPARPSSKLPHYTALFSLKFHIRSCCFLVVRLKELQAASALLLRCLLVHEDDSFHAHTRMSLDQIILYISPQADQLRWHAHRLLSAGHSNCIASALLLLAKLGSSFSHKREKFTCSMMGLKLPSSL